MPQRRRGERHPEEPPRAGRSSVPSRGAGPRSSRPPRHRRSSRAGRRRTPPPPARLPVARRRQVDLRLRLVQADLARDHGCVEHIRRVEAVVNPQPPGVRDQAGRHAARPRGADRPEHRLVGPQAREQPADQTVVLGDAEQGGELRLEFLVGEAAGFEPAQQRERLGSSRNSSRTDSGASPSASQKAANAVQMFVVNTPRSRRPGPYASAPWPGRLLTGSTPPGSRSGSSRTRGTSSRCCASSGSPAAART